MSQPNFIFDGDWTQVTFDGPGVFVLPFQEKGDTWTWEWHVYCTQRSDFYYGPRNNRIFSPGFVPFTEQMQSVATTRGIGYLVKEEEPQVGKSGAMVRFKRIYACVPYTRYEGTSAAWSRQFWSTSGLYSWDAPPSVEIIEIAMQLPCWWVYEYFLNSYAPLLYTQTKAALWGLLINIGASGLDLSQPFVAQTSEVGIYKAGITYRKTLYANWPPTSVG